MTIQSLFREDDTLVAGTLQGYRTWSLTPTGQLASMAMEYEWAHDELVAECLRSEPCPGAPNGRCTCGFYAWYTPDDGRIVPGPVIGVIRASGRILLGSHGFRAEKVQVVALVCGLPLLARVLRSHGYVVYPTLEQLVAAHPPEDMSGLIDHQCGLTCAGQAPEFHVRMPMAAALIPPSFVRQLPPLSHPRHAAPPPRWKRRAAAFGAGVGAAITTSGIVSGVGHLVQDGVSWLWSALTAFTVYGTVLWARLARRAWRWGQ